jgi:hypothetical protein
MTTLDVPDRYLGLRPVIITSPSTRCGTTMVQRLLTASSNAFIYGEEVGHQIRTVTVWLIGMLRVFEQAHPRTDEDFAQAMAGTLATWRPGLTAPVEVMRKAWIETYYQLPYTLAEFSRSQGRPVWGFKFPAFNRDTIRAMLMLMPETRVVYVIRNLCDALKSAKARRFATSEDEIGQFCADWASNMREMIDLALDQRVLFLKYEDLMADRGRCMELLQQFTGAENLDAHAFDLKVNTFEGAEADGHSPISYIAPCDLTDGERAIIMARAGPVLTHLYPDPFQAAA